MYIINFVVDIFLNFCWNPRKWLIQVINTDSRYWMLTYYFTCQIHKTSIFITGALSVYWPPAPLVIMGSVASIAGLFAFFLPETGGCPLPETMDDALNIGKNSTFKCYTISYQIPHIFRSDKRYQFPSKQT